MSLPSRRDLLAGASASLLAGCGPSRRPNVLLVLLDQLRAAALSAHGETNIATPHMDRLLDEATAFDCAWTANPVCAPARASLWTGLLSTTHGVYDNGWRFDPRHETVAQPLARAGYRTGYIGKWHLYGRSNPGFVPPSHRAGFDHWQAYNVSHKDRDLQWFEDASSPLRPTPRDAFGPDVQVDQALDFMRSDTGRPWFLVVSFGPPHPPGNAPLADWSPHLPDGALDRVDPQSLSLRPNVPDWIRSTNEAFRLADGSPDPGARAYLHGYYASILAMDDVVGRLVAGVDRVAPDTLIVFTSDHGEQGGSHGLYGKSEPYAESLEVPLGFRWPGVVPRSRRLEAPVSLLDLAPTLLDLAGARPLRRQHGRSLADVLLGAAPPDDRAVLAEGSVAGRAWHALRTRRWTYVKRHSPRAASLFDHATDPWQLADLAGDPSLRGVQNQLSDQLALARAILD